ncbi:hypothetical protein C349_05357 [Cryptococcus neoformans var. grubii Br795]|nr:hypothetical protein C349_05357 [Cryptococcus neoformans var. grubii Br795]OXG80530.1 hypothetical protein C346_05263 [Cryptococcus neoformans var. grubii D17-1]
MSRCSYFCRFLHGLELGADSGRMANPVLGGGLLLDVSAYPSVWTMPFLHRHPLNTDKKDPEILVTHQTIYPRSEHQLMTLRAILMTVKFFKFCHSPAGATLQREDSAEEEALGRSLSKLPARLGGLGLLSFKDVAPLAYRSACESADKLLGTLSLIPATEEPPPPTTQTFLRLTENASKLGRSWLSTIPLYQPLRLSDIDIASALHVRTLVGSSVPICRFCGASASLGHDELCRGRNPWSQWRHDTINRAIYQHLNQVNGAIIEIEPPTLSGQRRNDLRIRGTSSLPFTDYDLKVLSLGDNKARSTAVPHPPNSKLADFCFDRCVGWLDKVGKAVEKRAPRVAGGVFKPLILSTGGLASHETADERKAWREAMPEGVPSPTEED